MSNLLDAATIGGVKALLRDHLGRIATKDLVLVDLTVPHLRPVRDPLRSFVCYAADRAVRDVFVDGRQVVADRKVLTRDHDDAAEGLRDAQPRLMERVCGRDYRGRRAEEISPPSLPILE